jgi:hypothetical protein
VQFFYHPKKNNQTMRHSLDVHSNVNSNLIKQD